MNKSIICYFEPEVAIEYGADNAIVLQALKYLAGKTHTGKTTWRFLCGIIPFFEPEKIGACLSDLCERKLVITQQMPDYEHIFAFYWSFTPIKHEEYALDEINRLIYPTARIGRKKTQSPMVYNEYGPEILNDADIPDDI